MRMRHLILLLAAMALSSCSELGNSTGMISQRIGEVVREPGAKEVDFGKLTSFGWEYFYFFKPGTSRTVICEFIRAKRNECGRVIRYESVPATHLALFFGLNGHLTHTELHALANGEFDFELPQNGISRSSAVFLIRKGGGEPGQEKVTLVPK